jgi:hypothetical protein
MPKPPEASPTPAPDGFWDELRVQHLTLWTDKRVQHRARFLTIFARDMWAHTRTAEGETPLGVIVRWETRKRVGGTALGTMNINTMRVQDLQAINEQGASAAEGAAVENTRFAYALPEQHSREQPVIVARTSLYALRPGNEAPVQQENILNELQQARQGLIAPENVDYSRVLLELGIGATGAFRTPLER